MKNLRLISTIIVKDKLAIQSFNYKDYLPLGKVEIIVKNFDRWNSDEILVNCIDRSKKKLGPDFELLEKISSENISTPIWCSVRGKTTTSCIITTKNMQSGADVNNQEVNVVIYDTSLDTI